MNETVQLVLESQGGPGSRPDLSALTPDFEILDRRVSHNVSVINGQRSEHQVLTLRLRPRRVGDLTIPPIQFGDEATESLPLTVGAHPTGAFEAALTNSPSATADRSAPAPAVVVEVNLEPPQGYTGQQLILIAKVFTDGPIQGSRLYDPQISSAEILPLGEDRYQAERDGQEHQVYERRYALFPQDPGRLEIGHLLFEGWAPNAGGTDGGKGFPSRGQQVRALSGVLTTDIAPPPDPAGKDNWLPARGLSLIESGPETYRTHTGHPLERRISVRADGILARDLPPLTVAAPHQLAMQRKSPRLWDERRPEGVIGTRQEIVVLTADEPGRYRLPPVSLDWWSTTTGRWETARLPARDLVVSARPTGNHALPLPVTAASSQPRQAPHQPDQAEIANEEPEIPARAQRDHAAEPSGFWIWINIALGLAWIATITLWWRSKRRAVEVLPAPVAANAAPTVDASDPLESAIDSVRDAYQAGNAGAAREALLAWARLALPEQTPSNLARLAQRCTQPLRGQILLLEEAFFSPRPIAWDERPVWKWLAAFVPAPPEEPASFRRGKPIRRRTANPDAE